MNLTCQAVCSTHLSLSGKRFLYSTQKFFLLRNESAAVYPSGHTTQKKAHLQSTYPLQNHISSLFISFKHSLLITLLLVIFSIKSQELSVDKLKELRSINVPRNLQKSWVDVLLNPFLDNDSLRYSMICSNQEDKSKQERLVCSP
jgi:hypothetical protein